MIGCQTAPAQLFYNFCLDDYVPANHLLRRIDRPSVDPELMMRMLFVGYPPAVCRRQPIMHRDTLNLCFENSPGGWRQGTSLTC